MACRSSSWVNVNKSHSRSAVTVVETYEELLFAPRGARVRAADFQPQRVLTNAGRDRPVHDIQCFIELLLDGRVG